MDTFEWNIIDDLHDFENQHSFRDKREIKAIKKINKPRKYSIEDEKQNSISPKSKKIKHEKSETNTKIITSNTKRYKSTENDNNSNQNTRYTTR
jgi:hypothetical protein